jgi:phosphatidylcholine synthase
MAKARRPEFKMTGPVNESEKRALQHRGWRTVAAWAVHFYTALGLVAAAGIAVLLVKGQPEPADFRLAFVLMLVATLIDATDGTLARLVHIKEVLPGFDGRRLDDLVDFLTYTSLPLLLIWRAHLLPDGSEWFLLLPLIASAYGFCQVSAKTEDGFFLGFPSYWNLVAFYLYILQLPPWGALTLVVVLSLLTFVPTRYLYPSQRGRLNTFTNLLAAAWIGLVIWILVRLSVDDLSSDPMRQLVLVSLFFPVYYMAASWLVTLRIWRRRRRQKQIRAALP